VGPFVDIGWVRSVKSVKWNGKFYNTKELRPLFVALTPKHLAEGIAADYDTEGRLAGIEILDVVKRFGDKETLRQVVIECLGP